MKGLVWIDIFVGYDFTPPIIPLSEGERQVRKSYREDCCVLRIKTEYFVFRLQAYSYLRLLRSFKENQQI